MVERRPIDPNEPDPMYVYANRTDDLEPRPSLRKWVERYLACKTDQEMHDLGDIAPEDLDLEKHPVIIGVPFPDGAQVMVRVVAFRGEWDGGSDLFLGFFCWNKGSRETRVSPVEMQRRLPDVGAAICHVADVWVTVRNQAPTHVVRMRMPPWMFEKTIEHGLHSLVLRVPANFPNCGRHILSERNPDWKPRFPGPEMHG